MKKILASRRCRPAFSAGRRCAKLHKHEPRNPSATSSAPCSAPLGVTLNRLAWAQAEPTRQPEAQFERGSTAKVSSARSTRRRDALTSDIRARQLEARSVPTGASPPRTHDDGDRYGSYTVAGGPGYDDAGDGGTTTTTRRRAGRVQQWSTRARSADHARRVAASRPTTPPSPCRGGYSRAGRSKPRMPSRYPARCPRFPIGRHDYATLTAARASTISAQGPQSPVDACARHCRSSTRTSRGRGAYGGSK